VKKECVGKMMSKYILKTLKKTCFGWFLDKKRYVNNEQ
jgi:hypothetical protein